MKKLFALIFATITLLFAYSCNVLNSSELNSGGTAFIYNCRTAKGYDGEPIVIVSYKFTNNSDEPVSFLFMFASRAYQAGVELEDCYLVADSENYSWENQTKNIKGGATIDVEFAYELNDTYTDVEIELCNRWNGAKARKIFSFK